MSLLNQTIKKILPPDQRAIKFVENKLAQTMTNADGLGELKNLLLRYVGITGQIHPEIPKKFTIITCGDHGVAEMNVSAYPQETTAHMTKNYLISKGAVANCMSNFCGSDMIVVDMGIKAPVDDIPGLIDRKIAHGTQNCAKGPAMTREQAIRAIETGIELVNEGKVHLRPLISKTFAFKDYLKAYQYIDDNRETTMKVIINVQEK